MDEIDLLIYPLSGWGGLQILSVAEPENPFWNWGGGGGAIKCGRLDAFCSSNCST